MSLIVVGTNHKTSPFELRERLSFSQHAQKEALLLLKENPFFAGGVILSTCNRVELYASVEDSKVGIEELGNFLSGFKEIAKEKVFPYLYIYQEKEAIKHLFSVACGLDSLILGETQVLGQIKRAFQESKGTCFMDRYLDTVFAAAITFARKIHQTTAISKGRVSIGSVAIDFIKEKLGSLLGRRFLIIGVGKVTELVLKYLQEERPEVIFISNRSFEKAKELASQIKQQAVRFDEFGQVLSQADVVISATASPHFIIKKGSLEGMLPHQLLIIDLAMPRDVDPQVKEIEGVELFNLEDISSIAEKNLEKKILEAEKIRWLINQEVERLWSRIQNYREESLRDHEVLLKK